jgi:hypothetical protein
VGAETANTTASILRGTTSNQFGDQIDASTPVITGLPVTLIETGKRVQDPASPTPRTVRQIYASVPEWAGILDTDRLLDEQTGDTYIITSVTRPATIIGAPVDTVCQLKRVTANST